MSKVLSMILSLALCVSGLLMLVACGGSETETEAETRPIIETNGSASTAPETTAPETTAPETTAPETTAPETTAPETTAPETTEPETNEPETNEPETNEPETNEPETNEPETNEPETNEPETNEPETNEPETNEPETNEPQPHVHAWSEWVPVDPENAVAGETVEVFRECACSERETKTVDNWSATIK